MWLYKKSIPTYLTLIAIAFGWVSVILLIEGHMAWAVRVNVLAILLDFFDGYAARRLKATSDMGRNLDSLADVMIYLVFDALLCRLILKSHPYIAGFLGLLIIVCGVYRLARFTREGIEEQGARMYYKGLSVAHFSVIFIIIGYVYRYLTHLSDWTHWGYLYAFVVIVLSGLMVSWVRVRKVKSIGVLVVILGVLLMLTLAK